MATTTRYPIRIPLRLPRPIEPTESPASKPHRPQTPNLPPTLHTSAPCFRSNHRQPTRSNLHSLNSWPAVQCNEGFCNAPQSQCFTLTMTTASWKPHHSANAGEAIECPCYLLHAYVGSWHESEMPRRVLFGRFRGQTGHGADRNIASFDDSAARMSDANSNSKPVPRPQAFEAPQCLQSVLVAHTPEVEATGASGYGWRWTAAPSEDR